MTDDARPLLTLEPLIEAVQDGITRSGWVLSGLQKTTSPRFEGRWQGESSRSAYLFFHDDARPDFVSIDVFLDETTKGLKGISPWSLPARSWATGADCPIFSQPSQSHRRLSP